MKVMAVNADEGSWTSFVQSATNATSYHQFGWKEVITKSFGHRCHYLAAIDNEGCWQGVFPLVHMRSILFGSFLVSVPFVNYGGLLYRSNAAARILLDEAERLRCSCGAAHVELRHLERCPEEIPTRYHKVTMILELKDNVDCQWKAFNAKLRNQIRKAEKSGLQTAVGHLEFLDGFYEVFARNMRDLGTPVYGKKFFHNVLTVFPDTTRIFAVFLEEKMIAAGIALWFRDTIEIPWASSIIDYKNLCPNNMLYWSAIQFAIDHGFRKFDFGRSTPDEGTFKFKKQWGALPMQLYWQYLMDKRGKIPELNPSNQRFRTAIRIWQHLPISVTKAVGPLIVRNIP